MRHFTPKGFLEAATEARRLAQKNKRLYYVYSDFHTLRDRWHIRQRNPNYYDSTYWCFGPVGWSEIREGKWTSLEYLPEIK